MLLEERECVLLASQPSLQQHLHLLLLLSSLAHHPPGPAPKVPGSVLFPKWPQRDSPSSCSLEPAFPSKGIAHI